MRRRKRSAPSWPIWGELHRDRPFVWVYDDNITALREGAWKLVLGNADKSFATPLLYQIEDDPVEANDCAGAHPEVVQRLVHLAEEVLAQIPKVWSLKYPVRDPAKAKGGVRRK